MLARDKSPSSRSTPYPRKTTSRRPVFVVGHTAVLWGIRERKLLMKTHAIQPAFCAYSIGFGGFAWEPLYGRCGIKPALD